ncbi:GNAT family N-acetyltransferase [Sphingomonas donggukensis]|uniref:GNAT family N-acetyltransferase n=1 Tax=Sphingomonas donggukensis TaxID=2949093 RepID=A0ABY4TVT5_9SPHN|nr:GNAT family N-acetyltransferase [Sphingomonas donggukensis]URW76514.1 GNAT family N-acetyltransferase [Sphingomonas donggukensis]
MSDLTIRPAVRDDLARLHPVIERAYRGEAARAGWTHEADLVPGARTDLATLEAIVTDPHARLLVAFDGTDPVGSVHVESRGDGLAYRGLLSVDPQRQADGIGSRLIAAAEACARDTFGANAIEMTVIDVRTALIAYYERRGYALTGERRAFPVAVEPPLHLTVLVKPLP